MIPRSGLDREALTSNTSLSTSRLSPGRAGFGQSSADPGAILDAVDNDSHDGPGRSQLIERGRQIAEELGAHAPDKVKATLMALFCRVEIRSDRVDITLSRGRLTQLLAGSLDLKMQHQAPTSAPDDLLGLT